MDLEKFYNEKCPKHWAENLQIGDRCIATIRHKTDGSKNRHNVEVIVIENNIGDSEIKAFAGIEVIISYNNLTNIK